MNYVQAIKEENDRAAKITLAEFLKAFESEPKPQILPYKKPDGQVERTEEL